MIIQGIRYASDFEAKKLMIETGHNLDEKGYTLAQDGSMSVRVGPNAVWVTTGSSGNGALSQGDFVRVDLNGKSMNHSPDAVLPEDLEVHLKIYRENAQIQGIIHAYPVCAVVLQKNGRGLEACDYTPAVRAMGKITLVPKGDMGQTAAAAALAAQSDKGVLLESDGCLMWGASIQEAYRNIRVLDYCAQVKSLAGGCAGENPGTCKAGVLQHVEIPTSQAQPGNGIPEVARVGGSLSTSLQNRGDAGAASATKKHVSPAAISSLSMGGGQKTVSPDPAPVSAIPGLTGLYRPAGSSLAAGSPGAVSSGYRPSAAGNSGYRPPAAGNSGYRPPAAGNSVYKPSAVSPVYKPHAAVSSSGSSPASAGFGMIKQTAASAASATDSTMIQSAPSDPVRDATMAEVVRKSMKMMGKGGL